MAPNVLTGFVLVVVLHVVLFWDCYALFCLPKEATVSWVLQSWAKQHPIIAVAFGILIGHLFWPLQRG